MSTSLPELKWDERGLLPAVVQDVNTGAVLMLAWMNAEALEQTRATGFAHFYSRSRKSQWKKGETSGNVLHVEELRFDCDSDAILIAATPTGPTCHTGTTSCFFSRMDDDRSVSDAQTDDGPPGVPAAIAHLLEQVLLTRKADSSEEKSYTKSLLAKGTPKISAKIREEAEEMIAELNEGSDDKLIYETADLLFHMMVGLVARDVPIAKVWDELARRFGMSGHEEKASR